MKIKPLNSYKKKAIAKAVDLSNGELYDRHRCDAGWARNGYHP